MSGIIAVYGLVVAVLLAGQCKYQHTCWIRRWHAHALLQCRLLADTLCSRKFLFRSSQACRLTSLPFLFSGFIALAAGLSVGMGGLAAGYAIGIVGDYVSPADLCLCIVYTHRDMSVCSVFVDMLERAVCLSLWFWFWFSLKFLVSTVWSLHLFWTPRQTTVLVLLKQCKRRRSGKEKLMEII